MAHLIGINKGPVMDWTNDTGQMNAIESGRNEWKYYS